MAKKEPRSATPGNETTLFGTCLRSFREAAGLTQEELAARAGLTAKAVGVLERGERKRPYPHTVRALADALELSGDRRASLVAAVPKRGGRDNMAKATPAASGLPTPATPLVGRERETAEVAGLLRRTEVRLLTLTGTGGVVFVVLAPLSNPALVIPTVARSLGLRDTEAHTAFEALRAYLRDKRLLLVLDNFEHVSESAPEVAGLIESCPDLTILATSRAPLRIRGEREYLVEPLALPVSARLPAVEEVAGSSSGRLFVERARAASPIFELTVANVAAVAEICRRLAGLPLAVELAAARVKFLTPEMLLSRLDRILSAGWARDLPDRQRTMRATLDWSCDLLSERERTFFRRLSVFAGGFSLEAAETVGADDVLDALGGLVEQSLVTVEPHGNETRYGMLEPIRQYAFEMLRESGEEERTRGRHAGYYEALAVRAERELKGAGQMEWMERLGRGARQPARGDGLAAGSR